MARVAAVVLVLLSSVAATGEERSVRNLAFGLRDAVLVDVGVSPVDPDLIYLGTADGFVFVSRDGGRSWEEHRLVVGMEDFEGSSGGAWLPEDDESPEEALPGAAAAGIGALDLSDAFYFDHDATGAEFLESWDRPSAYDAVQVPGLPTAGQLSHGSMEGGIEIPDADEAAVATRRYRLGSALEEFSQWDWGMGAYGDVDELPIVRARVTSVVPHPTDARIALATTLSGTYRTDDSGRSWHSVSHGFGRWDRSATHAAFDPLDPQRVYLGTQKGVFISSDGGLSFAPAVRTSAETAWTHWLDATPVGNEIQLLAATSGNGILVSMDRGRTWKWMRWDGQEDKDYVTCVAADPRNPSHIYMGSLAGVDESVDGGGTWKEAGGLQLVTNPVYRIAQDPRRSGHLLVSTDRDVWESFDGGATWHHLYLDDGPFKVRRPVMVPGSDDVLVLTSGRLLRISPVGKSRAGGATDAAREALWSRAMEQEPSQSAVIAAIFEHMGVDAGEHRRLRARAPASHLLPELSLVGGYFSATGNAALSVTPWLGNAGLALDRVFDTETGYGSGYVAAMAWWDVGALVFSLDEVPRDWGRSELLSAQTSLKYEAVRYYDERLRTMRRLILERPEGEEELLDAALRYRELTEHLDLLTGGLYARQVSELGDGGVEWLAGVLY